MSDETTTNDGMSEELDVSQYAMDELSETVLLRFRDAYRWKNTHEVFQRQTINQLIESADRQLAKEYPEAALESIQEVFGTEEHPKYEGIALEKVEALADWYHDTYISGIKNVFTVRPTPVPTLDAASVARVKNRVLAELWRKMQEAGQDDPAMLLLSDGSPTPQFQTFLESEVRKMRKVEIGELLGIAQESAEEVQRIMEDRVVEGGFEPAYLEFTRDRFKYGRGIMKFPDWQRIRVLEHRGKRARPVFKVVPTFRTVDIRNFFPSPDAKFDLQKCLCVSERKLITKIDLANMAQQKNYRENAIADLIAEYDEQPRNWLPGGWDLVSDIGEGIAPNFWLPDKEITVLIHEGFFTGGDLAEMGIKGLKPTDFVNAHVEICGKRTIRCELIRMPYGEERSYFSAPFVFTGSTFWDSIGLAAQLADTEKWINEFLYLARENAIRSAVPPVLVNSGVFEDTEAVNDLRPNHIYKVNDSYATSGHLPEPMRGVQTSTAQYHILMSEAGVLRRNADDASGVPSYAYNSAGMGQAPLGEYAQRMSNALRKVKGAARKEDIYFTRPAFSVLFRDLVESDPDLAVGQDLQCEVAGMAGLLEESIKRMDWERLIPWMSQGVQVGALPPDVLKVGYRQMLTDNGFPIDQIAPDGNPLIDKVVDAVAADSQPPQPQGGQQIPKLDGRSQAIRGTVSSPNGVSPQIDLGGQ